MIKTCNDLTAAGKTGVSANGDADAVLDGASVVDRRVERRVGSWGIGRVGCENKRQIVVNDGKRRNDKDGTTAMKNATVMKITHPWRCRGPRGPLPGGFAAALFNLSNLSLCHGRTHGCWGLVDSGCQMGRRRVRCGYGLSWRSFGEVRNIKP